MPDPKPAPTVSHHVALAAAIRAQIASLQANLADEEAALIALGAGRYTDGHDNDCTVVAARDAGLPGVEYSALPAEAEDRARAIAGDHFVKLFERRVVHLCRDGFLHLCEALLTPARAREAQQLCAEPTKGTPAKKAYIIWK